MYESQRIGQTCGNMSIQAELQCFSLGDITHSHLNNNSNILAILDTNKTLFMFSLESEMDKKIIRPFHQIDFSQINNTSIQAISSLQFHQNKQRHTDVIVILNEKNQLRIWNILETNSLIATFENVSDFLINSSNQIKIMTRKLQNKQNEGNIQYQIENVNIVYKQPEVNQLLGMDNEDNKEVVLAFKSQKQVQCFEFPINSPQPKFINNQYIVSKNIIQSLEQKSHNEQFQRTILPTEQTVNILAISNHKCKIILYTVPSQIHKINIYEVEKGVLQIISFDHLKINESCSTQDIIGVKFIKNTNILALIIKNSSMVNLILIIPGIFIQGINNNSIKDQSILISKVNLLQIQKHRVLSANNRMLESNLYIINIQNHQIIKICLQGIIKVLNFADKQYKIITTSEQQKIQKQQEAIHLQTTKNLKHRLSSLKTLYSYLENYDVSTGLRFLQKCQNIGILNDGISMVASKQMVFLYNQQKNNPDIWSSYELFFQLCCKLFESKYQTHLQNALKNFIMLIQILSNVSLTTLNPGSQKEVKKLISLLNKLIENKRMAKLLQQQKRRVLFELAYELKNLVNSYGRIVR